VMAQKGPVRAEYIEAFQAGRFHEIPEEVLELVEDVAARMTEARVSSDEADDLPELPPADEAEGGANEVRFYPLVDDDAFAPALTSADSLVSAYLFDYRPSLADARTGAGALALAMPASWDWDPTAGAFTLALPPVDDPDPTSTAYARRVYFLAVSWRLQSGQQIQTTIQPVEFERPASHGAALVVTTADLAQVYPDIDVYGTAGQLAAVIAQATQDVRDKLLARGYRWAGLTRPDRLKQVVVLRALCVLMLAQAQQGADKFFAKYAEYKAMYLEALEGLRVEYDLSGDGVPDPAPTGGAGPVQTLFVVR
jgi:hypothetical protein